MLHNIAMAYRPIPFAPGEWFHCYTRSVDGSRLFEDQQIRERFLELLYLANQQSNTPEIARMRSADSHTRIFTTARSLPLVRIGAYCLMPNHYHLLIQSIDDGGVSKFMQRVGTGITHFYNQKHRRIGNIFIKPFRGKHVDEDRYFRKVTQYIHLNPLELLEPDWKQGRIRNSKASLQDLLKYPHSSLYDYAGTIRPQRAILDPSAMTQIRGHATPTSTILHDAVDYYRFLEIPL